MIEQGHESLFFCTQTEYREQVRPIRFLLPRLNVSLTLCSLCNSHDRPATPTSSRS